MDNGLIEVELAYALLDRQILLAFSVPVGTNARAAVMRSAIADHVPGLDIASCPLGIFGKALDKPEEKILQAGDRVEIYRPLVADPKEVRKRRAARASAVRD